MALMLREMSTTYGRSPGGYIWAILEPVAGIALMTFIFSMAFRSPPIGTNFALFYATGIVPFMMYTDISQKVGNCITFSKPLLFYSRVTYIDSLLARFFLNSLTQVMVFYLLLGGILVFFDTKTIIDYPSIILGVLMALSLGLGVGTLNCFLISMFPFWGRVWAILNRPMFIISCVIFIYDSVPEPYRGMLWYNPVVHVVGQVRHGFYPVYDAAYVSPIYVFGLSLLCILTGLILLYRYQRDILNF